MNPHIDPLILQKLQAFSDRRRQLIIRRGIFAAIATLLAAMMLVAFIDWLFVLPDAVRWALSGAAYLAILVVEWRSCVRLLISTPGRRRLARLVEHAEPKLREDLLSAVELGEARPEAVFDSEQFRALVQSDVAARMEKLDVEELLPGGLLRRYALVAGAVALAGVVALLFTGSQFGTLMMRALLPMANFARVSRVQVKIVEPAPAEMRVPQGDTLPLIVELSGQRAPKAVLETFTPSGGREVVPMTPLSGDRFSATIQVGRENVLYRVRAGDALTRKYQLEAVARPAVVEFQKAYTFPAYAKLESKQVTEENGDLAGLEGSTVELRLRTNQKVRGAELRIEQGKANSVVPLTVDGDALVAQIPLTTSGIYRVHLTGAESGFENKFSPEYELRVEPDLVPRVELELPKQDLILPSNEIVEVRGAATDDLALAKVSQLVKINDGAWKETPLSAAAGQPEAKVERRWDLFEQGVKPGDLVTMKLVATDLKGNTAESRPLQVTITAAGFEARRMQALLGQRALLQTLQAQAAAGTALAKQTAEARKEFERLPEGDAQRAATLAPALAVAEEFSQKYAAVAKQLTTVLREAVPGHQAANLVLLGSLTARFGIDDAPSAQANLETVKANTGHASAREMMREAHEAANRAERRSRQALEIFRTQLSAEELDVFNENLQVVAQEEERLTGLAHRSGTDPAKWAPVADRLRVVLAEIRSLEELTAALAEHGPHWVPDRARNLQKTLNKQRTTMEKALGAPAGGELLSPTLEMARAMGDLAREALNVRRDFRGIAAESTRLLLRESEPAYTIFEQVRHETARFFRNDRLPLEMSRACTASTWTAKLAVLKARGDGEENRPDADTTFISDVRLTSRVAQAFAARALEEKPAAYEKEWQGIDRTFRVLELGHEVAELHASVRLLATAERWEIYHPKSRTANPQDWNWSLERLRLLPEELGRALNFEERRALMQAAQKIFGEAQGRPFTQALNREMEERFNPTRLPVSGRESAEQLAEFLEQALVLFRPAMEEARQALTKLAPTLANTMKELAKKAEELKQETTHQAQQAQEKLPAEAQTDARQALAEQQRLNEKIDALKDALRADANRQSLLQGEGRERARDADDALAMLKEPPVRAAEDLALAAKSEKASVQEQALTQAAEQQQKLAAALEQMAAHYDALEQGKAEETRQAMRATEKANGIQEQLDQQFAKAEEMARLAQATPQELLAQLEKALPVNPQMQQELSGIAQNTLKAAGEQLKQASNQENAVAQSVQKMAADEQAQAAIAPVIPPAPAPAPGSAPPPNPAPPAEARPSAPANPMLAQAAQQQTPIAQAAQQAAGDISRAGRHEERMQNPIAGAQLQKLGEDLQKAAEQKIPGAEEALRQAQQAMQAQPAVSAANGELQKALAELQAATNPADPPVASAASALPNAPAMPSPSSAPHPPPSAAGPPPGATGQAAGTPSSPVSSAAAPSPTPVNAAGPVTASASAPAGAQSASERAGEMAAAPASPQEQVWMARALDALDAALNASASAPGQNAPAPPPNGSPQNPPQSSGNTSQATQTSAAQNASGQPAPQSNSMAQTQSALAQAAQAAAAAARAERSAEAGAPGQPGQPQPGSLQAMSKGGAAGAEPTSPRSALAEAKNRAGDWGKLPKQMAEQLTLGQREGIAGEYRNQVETYYRAIAEKSKKP